MAPRQSTYKMTSLAGLQALIHASKSFLNDALDFFSTGDRCCKTTTFFSGAWYTVVCARWVRWKGGGVSGCDASGGVRGGDRKVAVQAVAIERWRCKRLQCQWRRGRPPFQEYARAWRNCTEQLPHQTQTASEAAQTMAGDHGRRIWQANVPPR